MNRILGFALVAALSGAGAANAQNLVKNGNFDQVTNASGVAQAAQDNYVIKAPNNPNGFNLTSWNNTSGTAIVFGYGIGDSMAHQALDDRLASTRQTGCNSPEGYRECSWVLRSFANGGGGTAAANSVAAGSPAGGNFFGSDGNWLNGALSQQVDGFVVGQSYTLSFWSAGGTVRTGGNWGDETSSWTVTLKGAKTDVSKTVSTGSYSSVGGTTPWVQTVINFTASSTSELLTFTVGGTGSPPMSLLDGIAIMPGSNVVPVPEPGQWALFGGGLLLLGARLHRRRQR